MTNYLYLPVPCQGRVPKEAFGGGGAPWLGKFEGCLGRGKPLWGIGSDMDSLGPKKLNMARIS